MPSVPWSNGWFDVRISPDHRAVALFGMPEWIFRSIRESPEHQQIEARDGRPETLARVVPEVLVAGLEGSTDSWPARAEPNDYYRSGSWSGDSLRFALIDRQQRLVVLTAGATEPSVLLDAAVARLSPPAFSFHSDELAIARVPHRPFQSTRAEDGPDTVKEEILVLDSAGKLLRSGPLTGLPDHAQSLAIAWSPDDRFLFVATGSYMPGPSRTDVRLLDATTLQTIEARQHTDWISSGESFLPQWDAAARHIALNLGGRLQLLDLDETGHIVKERQQDVGARILRSCWTPSGSRVVLFTEKRVPDAREAVETVLGAGHARTHRTRYATLMFDIATGAVEELESFRHVGREEWDHPWMLPGPAEAFALWGR